MRSTTWMVAAMAVVVVCVGGVEGAWEQPPQTNMRPTVGIFTQPTSGSLAKGGDQYIAASYIKWVESAGGMVVPIRYDVSTAELRMLYEGVNGLFFPGGGTLLGNNVYTRNYQQLMAWAEEENKAGGWMPVTGTCFGTQEMIMYFADDFNILSGTNSENISLPLNFTDKAMDSPLYSAASAEVIKLLESQPVTMNNHHYSLLTTTYAKTPKLLDAIDVLSTNVDRDGIEFVSSIAAKDIPFASWQFHPEKPAYELTFPFPPGGYPEGINHSSDAIVANAFFSQWFLSLARSSSHKFNSSADELAAVIYSYPPPVFTEEMGYSFEQCYFFKNQQ